MRALVFCAGAGKRMRPLTQLMPKPLVPVLGIPMVVRQILALRRAGVTEIMLNAAHGARILQGAIGDGSRWGVRVAYSVEGNSTEEALETRGGIVKALPYLAEGGKAFLAVAGDIVTDYNYARLLERARLLDQSNADAHLVLVPNPSYHPRGDMSLAPSGRVGREGERLTFSSLAAYRTSLFEWLPAVEAKLFPWLWKIIDAGRVTGERWDGAWYNVGTIEERNRVEREIEARK